MSKALYSLPFMLLAIVVVANILRIGQPVNSGAPNDVCNFLKFKVNLVSNVNQKKIIFFGFSNVINGINTDVLQHEGKIPVLNFGLVANITFGHAFQLLEAVVKPKDILIISLPYFFYTKATGAENQEDLASEIALSCPINGFASLPLSLKIKALLKIRPKLMIEAIARRSGLSSIFGELGNTGNMFNTTSNGGIYSESGFKQLPSIRNREDHQLSKIKIGQQDLTQMIREKHHGLDALSELIEALRKRNVEIYHLFPPIYSETSYEDRALPLAVLKLMNRFGIPSINSPEDGYFGIDAFYDSVNHLTEEGAGLYTTSILNSLINRKVFDVSKDY
ncbi:hypothetical protein OAQ35_04030 [Litorivicinus sp.]|nr:hypothetical protein [Litorivicinus sp.]